MSNPQPKDVAASVQQRLVNLAKKAGDDPQHVLMRYGLERLMYRMSQSAHATLFTVKGAMAFLIWSGDPYRSTIDLDLTTRRACSMEQLRRTFIDICNVRVEEDGLKMLADSIAVEEIRDSAEYGGMRITLKAMLGAARIPLQVDIGFGDVVTPKAEEEDFPTLLGFPRPRLLVYPKETTIAEKYEALVRLGMLNSRMKDYYDLWALMREFEFDGALLKDAIVATFTRRKTQMPSDVPEGLSDRFGQDASKQTQWKAFIRRTRLRMSAEADLQIVVTGLRTFLVPPTLAAVQSRLFAMTWRKGGPWRG